MLNPAYKLSIGGKVVDTTDKPQASTTVDLTVALDLDTPADSFKLVLGNVGGLHPARDDEAIIELGYKDDQQLTKVMSGKVVSVEPNLTTTRVIGYSAADILMRTTAEQTYETKSAGDIARDLASKAKIDVEAASAGINFPYYVVDGRRSLYQHLHDLAELCGFDLYLNHENKIVFESFFNGKFVHILEFGKHIIELEILRTPQRVGRVEAWGESPTGTQGNNSAAWLSRDFSGSRGQAGSGSLFLFERSALRTRDAALLAAKAALTEIERRTLRGRVLMAGRPEIRLGDAIRLIGLPDNTLNGNYQVRNVTHRITKLGGFTTTVGFRAIIANPPPVVI